jgi:beta-lactamase class A
VCTQVRGAAVRHGDGTAGNHLLGEHGGPAELTAYLRSLGDMVIRTDRYEPTLTEAAPGDPRDTTSPRALALITDATAQAVATPS